MVDVWPVFDVELRIDGAHDRRIGVRGRILLPKDCARTTKILVLTGPVRFMYAQTRMKPSRGRPQGERRGGESKWLELLHARR